MKVLTCVDGSQWSGHALRHACRFLSPSDELILLYVAPRGGPGYVESGRMVLEASLRAAGLDRSREAAVQSKICIGDPKEMIPRVAEQEGADVIVMGAVGADGFPHVSDIGDTARETMERTNRPVVVCSPRGLELLLKDQGRLVTQPRAELARLARAMVTRPTETTAPPVADVALVSASERERLNRGWNLVEHLSRS